jgi:hypothetical protein
LQTTRAEILQLLGDPKHDKSGDGEYFDLDTETATFRWVHPTCPTQNSVEDERSIRPDDLVLQITVKPKYPTRSEDLGLVSDKAPPKQFSYWLDEDIECSGTTEASLTHCTITNGREGFGYSTAEGLITSIYYFALDAEAESWNQGHPSCATAGSKR